VIRFELSPPPANFDERVGARGAVWLADNPDAARPHAYWLEFSRALAAAFSDLCAYSAMYEPVGTVDHFVSCSEDRAKAYSWSNYRYASGWINSSKQALRSHQILDPFAVVNGWFEIILPSLQLVATNLVPEAYRERAELMLTRLHLRDDERVLRQRREWYRMYQEGELNLEGLAKKAPLIAAAVDQENKRLSRAP
jgi:hypothetical protein